MMNSAGSRLALIVAVGLVLTGLLLSCGTAPTKGQHSSGSLTTKGSSAGTCTASQLHLTLHGGGAAAGNVAQTFVLTNQSGSACTLDGYPSVNLLNAAGDTVFSITAHDGYLFPRMNPRPVALAAHGGTASFTIGMVDDTIYCLRGSRVQVTLPGAAAILTTNGAVYYCPADRADEDPYDSPILSGNNGTLP